MKLTLSWLKDHLDTEADLDTIVKTLTAIGLEVEGVENAAEKLKPFTIAEVKTAAPRTASSSSRSTARPTRSTAR